jgi:hypothetical protein
MRQADLTLRKKYLYKKALGSFEDENGVCYAFRIDEPLANGPTMKTNAADTYAELFTPDNLQALFPADRADRFFDALLGDPKEGAYDIRLSYDGFQAGQLRFALELHQRPSKCLACNLTYGLPTVFSRHPVIDIQGVVDAIAKLLDGRVRCSGWKLGATIEKSRQLHVVPLLIAAA